MSTTQAVVKAAVAVNAAVKATAAAIALVAIALVGIALVALAVTPAVLAQDTYKPTSVDRALYILSAIRDMEGCALKVEDGRAVVSDQAIRNPAMSCPDMFSWLLFTEAVGERFWTRWAGERQNWPAEPFQLCSRGGIPGESCCELGHPANPEGHCPVFPGDAVTALLDAGEPPPLRIGRPSVMDHLRDSGLEINPDLIRLRLDMPPPGEGLAAEDDSLSCPGAVIDQLIPEGSESIGRIIRQTTAEITVRNRTFNHYLFANNLYNLDGLTEVFRRNAENIPQRAPYRRPNRSAGGGPGGGQGADLARIDLPADAVMIKSNWLHEDLAAKLELEEDPEQPYVKKRLATEINYVDASGQARTCLLTGTHWMVAFHISSKDIPKWMWTTFEHVHLPGRCDITGCNDAYGFRSADALPSGATDNYVKPHQRADGLNSPRVVYARDQAYGVETIRPNLAAVLDRLGIGVSESADPTEPTPADRAWRSYRLKGSQIEYTDLEGRPTVLGNSVIEGGFMDGSSCVTCHARAGLHVAADGAATMFHLGVFSNALSDFGYARSHFGAPDPSWFLSSQTPPQLEVLQTDFVWGFFFAQPLVIGRANGGTR